MERDEAIRRAEMLKQWTQGENQYQFTTGSEPTLWQDVPDWSDDEIITTAGIFFDDYYQIRIKPKPLEYWAFFKDGHKLPCDSAPGWYKQDDLIDSKSGRWVRMVEKQ